MEFPEAKNKLIQAWGILGTNWGINKTMAQIHALLMIAPEPLSTEDIIEHLNISRGNANMNVRALLDWGIIYKEFKSGDRKEYFKSEKDIWALARQVARERRKRELEPIIKVLDEVQYLEENRTPEVQEFKEMTKKLRDFADASDGFLEKFMKSDNNWIFNSLLKIIKL
ncbi:MAG: MarR family transcriptional regulator [Bacteroidota bacterium]